MKFFFAFLNLLWKEDIKGLVCMRMWHVPYSEFGGSYCIFSLEEWKFLHQIRLFKLCKCSILSFIKLGVSRHPLNSLDSLLFSCVHKWDSGIYAESWKMFSSYSGLTKILLWKFQSKLIVYCKIFPSLDNIKACVIRINNCGSCNFFINKYNVLSLQYVIIAI